MKKRIYIYELDCCKVASEEQIQRMRISPERYFNLEGLPSEELAEKLEEFIWERGKMLAPSSMASEVTYYNNIREFLIDRKIQSLDAREEEKIIRMLKGWMLERGYALSSKKYRPAYDKIGIESPGIVRHMKKILKFLEEEDESCYDADISWYRWEAEADLDTLTDNLNSALKGRYEANPEAVMIAEHYGSPYDWLKGDQWDTVMNYDAFMEPLSWFLTGMEKHSDEENPALFGDGCAFFEAMRYHMSEMPTASVQCAMNELSNHDHSRFMTRTNRRVGRLASAGAKAAEEGISYGIFRQGVVMQMTWPGAPTIYYGDEAGVCGFTDPDNRRTYPWGRENKELLAFHKEMIRIHKQEKPLRKGSIKLLYAERNVLAYARFQEDEQIIVILNNSKDLKELTVPVWFAGVPKQGRMERLMYTYEEGYTTEYDEVIVENGEIVSNMGRHSAIVMKPISEGEKTWQGK